MTQDPASRTVVANPQQGGGAFSQFARTGSRLAERIAASSRVVDFSQRVSALESSVFSRAGSGNAAGQPETPRALRRAGAPSPICAPVLACLA